MMWDLAWSVAPFALSMTGSPGPNNVMVTATASQFGLRRTLPQIVGFTAGLGTMMLLMALGLGEVVAAFPALHDILKWIGGAYLLYLAWRIATAAGPQAQDGRAKPLSFIGAALFQLVNPKSWIASLGTVTTYMVADAAVWPQALTLAAVFVAVGTPAVTAWALFGHAAAKLLKDPRRLRVFNLGMAALLVGSVATLFI
jgi:threonine/homoserine/homoserine lactone efflux protein